MRYLRPRSPHRLSAFGERIFVNAERAGARRYPGGVSSA